jgi:bifunctional ADP-heptose synthase (sugar kinase/adenylyltransferase)
METKEYLSKIKGKISLNKIKEYMDEQASLTVLVIGDTIIDHYIFVQPKGRAIKDPILSVEYLNDEIYAGGILAIANHLSDFVKKVKVVTLVGDKEDKIDLINRAVRDNVDVKTFKKENSHTIVKKRYIDSNRNNKLFKVEYMNDKPITEALSDEILEYLDAEIPKYDLVLVGDFGHGFINDPIRRALEEKSKFLAVNVQSNSANMGYNYFISYKKMDFISMDEQEIRLPLHKRFEDIRELVKEAYDKFKFQNFIITRGKYGSMFVSNGKISEAPILTHSVKDTVGAGDALFAITSLFVYLKADSDIIPLIANSTGGIAANIMGNKESVKKENLFNFIKNINDGKEI